MELRGKGGRWDYSDCHDFYRPTDRTAVTGFAGRRDEIDPLRMAKPAQIKADWNYRQAFARR
jgi:hypothetical protein